MKLKELKSIICADVIVVYIHNTAQRFCRVDYNFVFWADDNVNLWDIYGDEEVDMIYTDYMSSSVDYEVICIDLK